MYCKKVIWLRGVSVVFFVAAVYLILFVTVNSKPSESDSQKQYQRLEENQQVYFYRSGDLTENPGSKFPNAKFSNDTEKPRIPIDFQSQAIPESKKKKLIQCVDSPSQTPHIGQRGSYWVLYNHVAATQFFGCDESITYTTNADLTFLDNLAPVVDRWRGPVSVAIYTPASDYNQTMLRIHYIRECVPLIKDLVTFHLFFDSKYMPQEIQDTTSPSAGVNVKTSEEFCKKSEGLMKFKSNFHTFRESKGLLYPVNVARNLARDMATTHYVLASDIELYPSPNFIPLFFKMIQDEKRNSGGGDDHRHHQPRVYVLPVFEVDQSIAVKDIPKTKHELLGLLKKGKAVHFHKKVCNECHQIPEQAKWLKAPIDEELHVFYKGKRKNGQRNWEPFYVGTREDPGWDERLTWEGRSNKMTQAYILCLLDYDFLILDNAFFVHRPGIKLPVKAVLRNPIVQQQDVLIKEIIKPELQTLYGKRNGCVLINSK